MSFFILALIFLLGILSFGWVMGSLSAPSTYDEVVGRQWGIQQVRVGDRVRVYNKGLESIGGRFLPFEGVLTKGYGLYGEVKTDGGEYRVVDFDCHTVDILTQQSLDKGDTDENR